MTSIVAYQKATDATTTYELRATHDSAQRQSDGERALVELAEIDGVTYVAVPDGVDLAAREKGDPATPVMLDLQLRAQLMAASPHVRLIRQRVQERIRADYSIEDELQFARIRSAAAAGDRKLTEDERAEITAFDVHVEMALEWGQAQLAKLGF